MTANDKSEKSIKGNESAGIWRGVEVALKRDYHRKIIVKIIFNQSPG